MAHVLPQLVDVSTSRQVYLLRKFSQTCVSFGDVQVRNDVISVVSNVFDGIDVVYILDL